MIRAILIALAVVVFVWWFIKKANQVRETKARVRLAYMKWLLEKSDQCDLKAEDDDSTKTWPVTGGLIKQTPSAPAGEKSSHKE